MKIAFHIQFIVLIFLSGQVLGQAPKHPDPELHLYILMGQSNMAGRGPLSPEYQAMQNPRVLVWSKDGNWEVAKHPLHYDKPSVAGVGPGLSFGLEMEKADPSVKIGLIPCAVGGTSIEKWVPGAYDQATKTHPYDDAFERIREAMKYGVVQGILWHQGESNSSPAHSKGYLSKLDALIKAVRKLAGNERIPVVIGELGRYKEVYLGFNEQLAKAPDVIPFSSVVSSEGFKDKGDLTHFDSPSATAFGKRFAAEMIRLQSKILSKK